MRLFIGLLIAMLWTCATIQAGTIVQITGGTTNSTQAGFGQGFTTPSGGPWNDITFNFFSDTGTTPTAAGTGYIFTSQYNGPPGGLSSSSFLAQSTGISAGSYVFTPSFTLQPNTQYFLYEDTGMSLNLQTVSGTYFSASAPGSPFQPGTGTTNFRVSGDVVVSNVPEPAAVSLAGTGLALLLAVAAWRRRNTT